jgi:hypothetical protein
MPPPFTWCSGIFSVGVPVRPEQIFVFVFKCKFVFVVTDWCCNIMMGCMETAVWIFHSEQYLGFIMSIKEFSGFKTF